MPVTTRLYVAGVLVATAVALPAAALAGNNSTGKTPSAAPSATASDTAKPSSPEAGPSLSDVAARLASRLGVSTSAAEHALEQLQGDSSSSQIAAVAHELGVTPARLNAAMVAVKMSFAPAGSRDVKPGQGPGLTALPGAAEALASHLGVSLSAAQRAMNQIGALDARENGINSTDPQFIAIAHQLGVSTSQLDHALRAVKESFAR
ncbi:MAG: hypothetical protein J2P22_18025 [Nocardioides sp.]|nr:hypothetical protein [Nocardioides sp.]